MFNWAKQQLANVAGTQEPIYGPSALRTVAEEAKETPYTELTRDDLKWKQMEWTNVEVQSFYLFAEDGRVCIAQVIYSGVAGIRTTCQFTCKIFSKDAAKPHMWSSSPLSNFKISDDKCSFYADDCTLELSEDGNTFTIKSRNDQRSIVDLKVTKTAPGYQGGKSGTTSYGTDLENPWGWMRHAFWPRCTSEGTILTQEGPIEFNSRAFYVYALQGMKPHHAAARWNFVNFQGPTYSAILMEFTTPPSYGCTVVNVGGIAKDGEIVAAGCDNSVSHVAIKKDEESGWDTPSEAKYVWNNKSKDGKTVEGSIDAVLGDRLDRVDVMAEVPGFVKTLVATTVGTKPYVYQYGAKATLKLKIGDEEITEEGQLFAEATFISDLTTEE